MAVNLTYFEKKWERENQMLEFSEKVREYLEENRESFLSDWAEACEKTSGRISYEDMEIVLGRNYPKAKWIPESDKKGQIIAFFNELGYPFRADENHLFFP